MKTSEHNLCSTTLDSTMPDTQTTAYTTDDTIIGTTITIKTQLGQPTRTIVLSDAEKRKLAQNIGLSLNTATGLKVSNFIKARQPTPRPV